MADQSQYLAVYYNSFITLWLWVQCISNKSVSISIFKCMVIPFCLESHTPWATTNNNGNIFYSIITRFATMG